MAEQRYTKDCYAVKFLKSCFYQDHSFIYREIEALKRLYHKNIVKLINYCILDDNKLVFILEYVPGGSLKGNFFIKEEYQRHKKKMTEIEVRNIFKQIVKTVYYFHCKGIIHGDLKLDNILINNHEDLSIKVIVWVIIDY
jgi:serine/threonine protein kinase